ncbi:MAG: hypothetical protein AAF800_00590 [Planctomycetota bacterium]
MPRPAKPDRPRPGPRKKFRKPAAAAAGEAGPGSRAKLTTRTAQGRRDLARVALDRLKLEAQISTLWQLKGTTLDRFAERSLNPRSSYEDAVKWLLDRGEGVSRTAAGRFQEAFRHACHAEISGRPLATSHHDRRSVSRKGCARKRQARSAQPR